MILGINDEHDAHGIDSQKDYDESIVPLSKKSGKEGGGKMF